MRSQLRKIGNSLDVIIPATFIRQLSLVEGADIEVKADGKKITIEPIKRPKKRFPFSEKVPLNGLDAHTAHADELAVVSGNELENTMKSAVTPRFVCVLLISIFIMSESYRLVDVLNGVWGLSVEVSVILKILLGSSALPFFMKFANKK